jgi:cytochrome c oxidase subunit 4
MTRHVASVRTYILVFAALIALTVTTVAVSKLELGEYNFICAMTIAVIKGTLVVLFFMHVKGSSSMTKLFVTAGLFWMVILVVFVLSDYVSRGWLPGGSWWSSAGVLGGH